MYGFVLDVRIGWEKLARKALRRIYLNMTSHRPRLRWSTSRFATQGGMIEGQIDSGAVWRSFKLPLSLLVSSESWLLAFTASASECLFPLGVCKFYYAKRQKTRFLVILCARELRVKGLCDLWQVQRIYFHGCDVRAMLVEFSKRKWIIHCWVHLCITNIYDFLWWFQFFFFVFLSQRKSTFNYEKLSNVLIDKTNF